MAFYIYGIDCLQLVVLFRFFETSTFDCFCLLCAYVGIRMRICVRVFSFYHLCYLQSFLCCDIFELLWYASFYGLTWVALLNIYYIVIDTSTL